MVFYNRCIWKRDTFYLELPKLLEKTNCWWGWPPSNWMQSLERDRSAVGSTEMNINLPHTDTPACIRHNQKCADVCVCVLSVCSSLRLPRVRRGLTGASRWRYTFLVPGELDHDPLICKEVKITEPLSYRPDLEISYNKRLGTSGTKVNTTIPGYLLVVSKLFALLVFGKLSSWLLDKPGGFKRSKLCWYLLRLLFKYG